MTNQEALKNVGGLSSASKMPCKSWGLNPNRCLTGQILSLKKGSTCSFCYGKHGYYVIYPNVRKAQEQRFENWVSDRKLWVESMVFLLKKEKYFRWFDCGDIQGEKMLSDIFSVARQCPETKFWLPTKEYQLIKNVEPPKNLTIRVSAPMVNQFIVSRFPTSSVFEGKATCVAYTQGGKCLDCRKCWDRKVKNIIYPLH